MQSLDTVKNALLSVMPNVGHYKAFKEEPPYCVWAEDGAIALRSDNRTGDQGFGGYAHLFTLTENDPLVRKIQAAFNNVGISWSLEAVQYEDDTGYIHYTWGWEVG